MSPLPFPVMNVFSRSRTIRNIFLLTMCMGSLFCVQAKGTTSDYSIANPVLVTAFYKETGGKTFWFPEHDNALLLRQSLLSLLSQCETQGLDPGKYAEGILRAHLLDTNAATDPEMFADRLFTDVAITYLKDVLTGVFPDRTIGYDELSGKAKNDDNRCVLHLLAGCTDSASLQKVADSLEPSSKEYLLLKTALYTALQAKQQDTVQQLKVALNVYRWIHHFHDAKFVVVNIASGKLCFYEQDSLMLEMKVVTGTPATPTPRFAAYCDQVILYPYWNVPRSIAVNEFLPLCKKAPGVLAFMNIQVLDRKGKILDPQKINWKAFNKKNFPYRFRQSTGCDNALGVIKFNLTSPYGVYLHDTNAKSSFAAKKRYFSHGCIRLEKPMELANYLLEKDLDKNFLEACLKDEKPVTLDLPAPVPVFVVYLRAGTEADNVVYYTNIYKILP